MQGKKIGIFGYGSQGRAHALNLRDAGYEVLIANKKDNYSKLIKKDGFKIKDFKFVAQNSDVLFVLLPNSLHKKFFNEIIFKFAKPNTILVIAHGYSLYYQQVKIKKNFNWYLLAPRYPGIIIRNKYQKKEKIIAFHSTIFSNHKKFDKIFKSISNKIGYSLQKKFNVSYKHETELDLFVENFLIPQIINTIEQSFKFLSKKKISKEAIMMDIHSSGELSELFYRSRLEGIHQIWRKVASPTCRFAIFENILKLKKNASQINKQMSYCFSDIKNGNFNKRLNNEFKQNLKNLKKFDKQMDNTLFYKTIKKLND